MKYLLIFFLLALNNYIEVKAQPFEIISGCIDSIHIGPIKNVTILEPLVQHDILVIKNTIQSTVEEEIDSRINYRFLDIDAYKTKANNFITINLKDIAKSQKEYDAILVIQYALIQSYDNSESYNYSQVSMYLYDNKCMLIAKSSHIALSGDSFGITRNPLKGVKTATEKSINSIIKKIADINNNMQ